MTVYEFEGRVPRIGENSYVSPSAAVIGKVTLGRQCYVAPGAVIKGDYGEIVIGDGTNVQDNVIVHARPNEKTVIGNDVTLGHGCIVHNAVIEDYATIGMGAIVSDYAIVRKWAVVGEGAVVKARDEIPEASVAVGIPARAIRELDEQHKKEFEEYKGIYRSLARRYPSGLKRLS
ncbi:MAG: gamma carbonic anhydrase family protein [Candidatus Thorarchaeota archaeon]|nr:MAG: gamma carbonic anhydrase family protein [Candidatus Thorarchaeota archaeon]RLI58475.1 MAG: gamma carbonic anhydrase family protein [Candidatus Thorarchaeota archaeon]